MNLTRSKKKDLLYVAVAAFFFLTACVLQTVDDYISDWSVKKTIALLTQYIFSKTLISFQNRKTPEHKFLHLT